MLDANSPAFRQQYPNGATVYDRTGRRIANVFAYNPETGEAITADSRQLTRAWIRLVNRLPLQQWWRDVSICKRHGFWPAPLTIEPTPARRNPPEFSPAELPELRCWYSADDGVYLDSKTGQKFLRDLSGNGGRMIVSDGVSEALFIDIR
jgi:hypothetical protein